MQYVKSKNRASAFKWNHFILASSICQHMNVGKFNKKKQHFEQKAERIMSTAAT